jgi:hypothetical protein
LAQRQHHAIGAVTAKKDDAPTADQVAITNLVGLKLFSGGGGDKSTLLDLVQLKLRTKVKIVPVVAKLLLGHGLRLGPDSDPGRLRSLQQALNCMQVSLEKIFGDFYPDRLLICEPGNIDGLAYWPGYRFYQHAPLDRSAVGRTILPQATLG